MLNNDGSWKTRSFWLNTDDYTPGHALDTSTTADVVIVGGGFTGLWTANMLKEADPSLDVVVLEREVCGFGGSGRNGGFAMTLLDFSLHHLMVNQGMERARAAHLAVANSIHEIGAFIDKNTIDCEWEFNGYFEIATNPSHLRRLKLDIEAAERMNLTGWEYRDKAAAREVLDSPRVLAGVFEEDCAIVNPAKLAHGLREVALQRGVRVFEGTPVTRYEITSEGVRFHTPVGVVSGTQGVLSVNPWAKDFDPFKSVSIPVYTYAMASDPLSDEQLDKLGWRGRQGIEDKRNYIHYFRLTKENRIVWAGGDAIYYYGSQLGTKVDRRPSTYEYLMQTFNWYFPQLSGLRFPYRWGGPVSVTADFLPYLGTIPNSNLHYAFGCNGHGVAPSHTWGEILRDFCLGRKTDRTDLLFVGRKEIKFPPEPLRYVGAELTRQSMRRQDRQMSAGKDVGDTDPLILKLLKKFS